jgi:hypothetical protein
MLSMLVSLRESRRRRMHIKCEASVPCPVHQLPQAVPLLELTGRGHVVSGGSDPQSH